MHQNSLAAHYSNKYDARSRAILESIRSAGKASDHTLATRLGLPHRQDVAPRVTTLIALNALAVASTERDPVTHKWVRVVDLYDRVPRPATPPDPAPAAREAWRDTVASAPPGLKPVVSDQLNMGF